MWLIEKFKSCCTWLFNCCKRDNNVNNPPANEAADNPGNDNIDDGNAAAGSVGLIAAQPGRIAGSSDSSEPDEKRQVAHSKSYVYGAKHTASDLPTMTASHASRAPQAEPVVAPVPPVDSKVVASADASSARSSVSSTLPADSAVGRGRIFGPQVNTAPAAGRVSVSPEAGVTAARAARSVGMFSDGRAAAAVGRVAEQKENSQSMSTQQLLAEAAAVTAGPPIPGAVVDSSSRSKSNQ